MTSCFPFKVNFVNEDEQMYQIVADFNLPDLAAYKALFNMYNSPAGLISLVDITMLIIEDNAPALLDNMDFDEEGYQLDMHVDSENNLQQLISIVCPTYQDLKELEIYVRKTAGRSSSF